MKKKIFSIYALIFCISMFSVVGLAASSSRADNIKSIGRINFEDKVIIDSADFKYLANEIDTLESTYKIKTIEALNAIGGKHDIGNALNKGFSEINEAIMNSQDIPDTSTGAAENNLSSGTAAWVEGRLVIGNGKNEENSYNEGYSKGVADGLGKANIVYTYHNHDDSCYTVCNYTRELGEPWSQYQDYYSRTFWYQWERADHSYCGNREKQHVFDTRDQAYDPGRWTGSHKIFICTKTEKTIESATIVFQ